MGGSKSGGSSTTSNTPLTAEQYDPYGQSYRKTHMANLSKKVLGETGLSPEEKSYYRGQGLGAVEDSYANNAKSLRENFARAGIGPNDGAFAESLGSLLRDKYSSRVGVETDLTGKDLAMKQQNLANLISLVNQTAMPVSAGSTTTTSGNQGSTAKNVLGGALGGGLGGLGMANALALSNPWTAGLGIGGAILGGLGGLF